MKIRQRHGSITEIEECLAFMKKNILNGVATEEEKLALYETATTDTLINALKQKRLSVYFDDDVDPEKMIAMTYGRSRRQEGIWVALGFYIDEEYRSKGLTYIIRDIGRKLAKEAGFVYMEMVSISTVEPIMIKNGWEIIERYTHNNMNLTRYRIKL
jgi:hypothetical protein